MIDVDQIKKGDLLVLNKNYTVYDEADMFIVTRGRHRRDGWPNYDAIEVFHLPSEANNHGACDAPKIRHLSIGWVREFLRKVETR